MKSYLKFLSRNKLYTAIEAAGRIYMYGRPAQFNGQRIQGTPDVYEVDPEFFEFLPPTFLAGDERVLQDRSQVILGETFARRLSPDLDLLGLVAMSAYYAGMQTRDIAVRKVFGGSVTSETVRSVREYMILVGIAVLVGVPVTVVLAERYLRQFWYRIEGYGWVFVVGAVIALAISFLAVLWQTLKAAKTNPAVELKKE